MPESLKLQTSRAMTIATAGGDVFEIAAGMERIGKNFYEILALGSDDIRFRDFCLKTAREEAAHLAAFRLMQEEWNRSVSSGSVTGETLVVLSVLARSNVQPDPASVEKVAAGGSLDAALNLATRMELDAVLFYQELITRLPDSGQAIQRIVDEERRHLAGLRLLASPSRS